MNFEVVKPFAKGLVGLAAAYMVCQTNVTVTKTVVRTVVREATKCTNVARGFFFTYVLDKPNVGNKGSSYREFHGPNGEHKKRTEEALKLLMFGSSTLVVVAVAHYFKCQEAANKVLGFTMLQMTNHPIVQIVL